MMISREHCDGRRETKSPTLLAKRDPSNEKTKKENLYLRTTFEMKTFAQFCFVS